MKLIGKQIVVELPKKKYWVGKISERQATSQKCREGWNDALTEVAEMNPAWEVDEDALSKEIQKYFGIIEVHPDDMTKLDVAKIIEKLVNWNITNGLAQSLTSNPSAWLKRKDVK